jgi:hypothetical protein
MKEWNNDMVALTTTTNTKHLLDNLMYLFISLPYPTLYGYGYGMGSDLNKLEALTLGGW